MVQNEKMSVPANPARSWKRLDDVDLLRGLAIFFVLMNHVNVRLQIAKVPYTRGDSRPTGFLACLEWPVRRSDILRRLRVSHYVDHFAPLGRAFPRRPARFLPAAVCPHRAAAPAAARGPERPRFRATQRLRGAGEPGRAWPRARRRAHFSRESSGIPARISSGQLGHSLVPFD
jgi:hypothetical protein